MGRRGAGIIIVSVGVAFLLAAIEYLIAILMACFIFSLQRLTPPDLPRWLLWDPGDASPIRVWLALVLVGALRAGCLFTSRQAGHLLLELVRARLFLVHGYDAVASDRKIMPSLSQMNMRIWESFPKTAEFVRHLVGLCGSLVLAAAVFGGMVVVAWREALAGGLCLAAAGIVMLRLTSRARLRARRQWEHRLGAERTLVRIYRNWALIRVMRLKEKEYGSFLGSVARGFDIARKQARSQNAIASLPPLLGLMAMAVVIYASVASFSTPPAVLLGFIYLFVRLTQTLSLAAEDLGALRQLQPHAEDTIAFISTLSSDELTQALRHERSLRLFGRSDVALDAAERKLAHRANDPGVRSGPDAGPPEIVVSDLSYSWPDASTPALSGISFRIPPGSVFAVVGPNGCGKSTLLSTVLGLLPPTSGAVSLAGMPSSEYLRAGRLVGYAGADPCLIEGTVRENLLYGTTAPPEDEELLRVLGLVGLADAIGPQKELLDYTLGENGEGLSLGERQRLALARAFIRKPVLLVLDEATSSVDAETEKELAAVLRSLKGKCTVLMASHRSGILDAADQILDMGESADRR